MAGAVRVLDSGAKTVAVDVDIPGGGGHAAATFILNTTAITGTWTVTLQYQVDGVFFDIATVTRTAAEGTGIEKFVLTAGEFDLTRQAIPEPTRVSYAEDVAGGLTAEVYAFYGD